MGPRYPRSGHRAGVDLPKQASTAAPPNDHLAGSTAATPNDHLAGSTAATLNYHLAGSGAPFTFSEGPGQPVLRRGGSVDPREVRIRNGRELRPRPSLDRQGFRLVRHPTGVKRFFDATEVRSVYFSEMEALIRAETGASRVLLFDPTLRAGDAAGDGPLRPPVLQVHNDFTERSAPQPVRDLLPAEADVLLKRRFAILQVWRPLDHPVESRPLALADAASVDPAHWVVATRAYPGWTGEWHQLTYHPSHRWYWFPRMRPDEAVIFKVHDSLIDGRARWTPHTAFVDPLAPPTARPRHSIEVRAVAFF
jgi:hypothetical protein